MRSFPFRMLISCCAMAATFCSVRVALSQQQATASPTALSTTDVKPPTQDYLVYVVSEWADKITLLRFGPHGIVKEHETHIGVMPVDINGPHGIAVSPDKDYFYVAVGHGKPDGSLWKFKTGTDQLVKYIPLGNVSCDDGHLKRRRVCIRGECELSR